MTQIYFNCGEFLPGKRPISPIVPHLPVPVAPRIPAPRPCCTVIPGPPAIIRPPTDEWVCVCAAQCTEDPTACLENRACMRRRDVPIGLRHGRGFPSFQDCVDRGFAEPPCWMCGTKCTEIIIPCPPPRTDLPKIIDRECVVCPNARTQTGACAAFPSIRECQNFCRDEVFECPTPVAPITGPRPIGPVTPIGGGIAVTPITPVGRRGPITPTISYKCVQLGRTFCPPPREDLVEFILQRCEWCFEDFGNGIGRRPDNTIGPRPHDCPVQTSQQCLERGGAGGTRCENIRVNQCPTGPITPDSGVRPVSPVIRPPGIVIAPIIGPITPTDSFRCRAVEITCDPPHQNITEKIIQSCIRCFTDLGDGIGIREDGSRGPRPANCPPQTIQNCQRSGGRDGGRCVDIPLNTCPRGPITEGPIAVTGEGGSIIFGFGNNLGQGQPFFNLLNQNSQNLLGKKLNLGLGTISNDLFSIQVTNKQRIINIDDEAKKSRISNEQGTEIQSIYHREYNLIQYPIVSEVKFVTNTQYLNIFREVVPEEIAYILNIGSTSGPWNEYSYTQLTKEKMLVAIQFNLLKSLSNVHFIDGTPISVDFFIETLRMLLAEARLDEFDSQFYIDLAVKQQNDEFLVIQNSSDQNVQEQAALGILGTEAINADPEQHRDDYEKFWLLRTRRLNTDIKAGIPIIRFDGVTDPIPLVEAGLQVVTLTDIGLPVVDSEVSGTSYLPLGDGFGYYFSATLTNSSVVPLRTDNQLSSTYYIPPATRDTVLKLFNRDPAITLRTTSVSGRSEFDENYDGNSIISPMYFALNLASLGDIEKINPLIREVSGTYINLETDEEIISHARNHGISVSKVFVNYDDPFFRYLKESLSVDFTQSDVSFEGTFPDTGALNNQLISRNVAFGLIFIPVRGSKFNPFAQKSQLISYSEPYIRELRIINHVGFSKDIKNVPGLDEKVLFLETGERQIGIAETPNIHNVVFMWNSSSADYSNLYFSGGQYITDQPHINDPVTRRLIFDLIEGTLSSTYGHLSSITWWDIYRRLSGKDMAEIAFQIPKKFLEKLAEGLRGYRIRNILQREGNIGTNLPLLDSVILTVDTRRNPTNPII